MLIYFMEGGGLEILSPKVLQEAREHAASSRTFHREGTSSPPFPNRLGNSSRPADMSVPHGVLGRPRWAAGPSCCRLESCSMVHMQAKACGQHQSETGFKEQLP